jgi:hypothetical protein
VIKNIKENFFISSASGEFLEVLSQNLGIERPQGSDLNDASYREYIKLMSFQPKQILYSLYNLVELFYGESNSRIIVTNQKEEPFQINEDVIFEIETSFGTEIFSFKKEEFSSNVSSIEMASKLNSIAKNVIFQTIIDTITFKRFIQIRSKSRGLSGFIKIKGGNLNNILQFPQIADFNFTNGTEVILIQDESTQILKIINGIVPSAYDLSAGDFINIFGQDIDIKNHGTFVITSIQYETILGVTKPIIYWENPINISQNLIINSNTQITIQKNKQFTLLNNSRKTLIMEIVNNELKVIIPITPNISNTKLHSSLHLTGLSKRINRVFSTQIDLENTTGVPFSGKFSVFSKMGFVKKYNYTTVNNESISGINEKINLQGTEYQIINTYTNIGQKDLFIEFNENHNIYNGELVRLNKLQLIDDKNINKHYTSEVINSNTIKITVDTDVTIPIDYLPTGTVITGQSMILQFHSLPVQLYKGSYIFNPQKGTFEISSTKTKLAAKIISGFYGETIKVEDSSGWNQSGYLIINYGTKNEEGPIRYVNIINKNEILIDPSYVYLNTHEINENINFVPSLTQLPINIYGEDGCGYLNDQTNVRELLIKLLKENISASVKLTIEIVDVKNYYLK